MSSIRDLLDPEDVDPLEDQRNKRVRYAAELRLQQQRIQQDLGQTLYQISPNNPGHGPAGDNTYLMSSTVRETAMTPPYPTRPDKPAAVNASELPLGSEISDVGSAASSTAPSLRRSSIQRSESEVRLTPVTGRVSRARKGQPVHICDRCDPPKTFSRNEHLRRHLLSHDKAQYPCTFPECEKTFHRPDLLSRHQARHDAGEQAFKAGRADTSELGSPASQVQQSLSDSATSQEPGYEAESHNMAASRSSSTNHGGNYGEPANTTPGFFDNLDFSSLPDPASEISFLNEVRIEGLHEPNSRPPQYIQTNITVFEENLPFTHLGTRAGDLHARGTTSIVPEPLFDVDPAMNAELHQGPRFVHALSTSSPSNSSSYESSVIAFNMSPHIVSDPAATVHYTGGHESPSKLDFSGTNSPFRPLEPH